MLNAFDIPGAEKDSQGGLELAVLDAFNISEAEKDSQDDLAIGLAMLDNSLYGKKS